MNIDSNILRYALKNAYFINGTAYAGKSTMVKLLAEKYDGILCEENYHLRLEDAADETLQPNISYLKNLKDWRLFVRRTPEEYEAWVSGGQREIASLELVLLLQYAQTGRKIFVDTNLSPDILREIASPSHVLFMLSTQETAVNRFFQREDREKQFLYRLLLNEEDPQAAMDNFRACLERVNDEEHRRVFTQSGFPVLERDDSRSVEQTLSLVERCFGLCECAREGREP